MVPQESRTLPPDDPEILGLDFLLFCGLVLLVLWFGAILFAGATRERHPVLYGIGRWVSFGIPLFLLGFLILGFLSQD